MISTDLKYFLFTKASYRHNAVGFGRMNKAIKEGPIFSERLKCHEDISSTWVRSKLSTMWSFLLLLSGNVRKLKKSAVHCLTSNLSNYVAVKGPREETSLLLVLCETEFGSCTFSKD